MVGTQSDRGDESTTTRSPDNRLRPMSVRPVLAEWEGEKLVYVSPRETINRFGYTSLSQRDDISPEEVDLSSQIEARVPLQDGEVAASRRDLGVRDATAWITARARELGADMVGITRVDPFYVYDGFDLTNDYAVVTAIAMDYEGEILQVPRRESHVEYLRIYEALSTPRRAVGGGDPCCGLFAVRIRSAMNGWRCSHTLTRLGLGSSASTAR